MFSWLQSFYSIVVSVPKKPSGTYSIKSVSEIVYFNPLNPFRVSLISCFSSNPVLYFLPIPFPFSVFAWMCRGPASDWFDVLHPYLSYSSKIRRWFVDTVFLQNKHRFSEYLLESPSTEVLLFTPVLGISGIFNERKWDWRLHYKFLLAQ